MVLTGCGFPFFMGLFCFLLLLLGFFKSKAGENPFLVVCVVVGVGVVSGDGIAGVEVMKMLG